MLPDRVSNPGPLTYESGALPIALRGPAYLCIKMISHVLLGRRERGGVGVRGGSGGKEGRNVGMRGGGALSG